MITENIQPPDEPEMKACIECEGDVCNFCNGTGEIPVVDEWYFEEKEETEND